MAFADKSEINKRLRELKKVRAHRIRLLIEKGVIGSADDVPDHAIPIDINKSTLAKTVVPPAYYEDIDYECIDCGSHEVWRAETQQYYFEVIQASPFSLAVRCPDCQKRHKETKPGSKTEAP